MADLDPDAAAFLDATKDAPRIQHGTPQEARDNHVASAQKLAGSGPEMESVADHTVDGVPVRRYRPAAAAGTTVYVHGGGWVVGNLETYDTLCRELAASSGSTVLSVGYDLAPEARHPRPVEQVMAVLRATVPGGGQVAIAGDSAGGYLAALAAQLCQDEGLPLAAQGLIYPCIDPALDTVSAKENAAGYYLETDGMRWYWSHYLGDGAASALVARPGLPPTYVLIAGFDPLRDEDRTYADALEAAGVPVTRIEYDGQIHGFVRFTAAIAAARPALYELGAFLREHLRRSN